MWSCVQQDVNRLHFTMIARLRGNLVEVCVFLLDLLSCLLPRKRFTLADTA